MAFASPVIDCGKVKDQVKISAEHTCRSRHASSTVSSRFDTKTFLAEDVLLDGSGDHSRDFRPISLKLAEVARHALSGYFATVFINQLLVYSTSFADLVFYLFGKQLATPLVIVASGDVCFAFRQ